jgi:DNA-binding Lrp family transcriptional regulator
MRGAAYLDELDRLLVTALQTSPRASWQQVGQVLDISASTAARRWDRLSGEGLAWFSCHPLRLPGTPLVRAIIEIDCVAERLPSVGTTLARDPHLVNVDHVSGAHDLVVIGVFSDQISLGRYLRFRIGRLDGVQSVHPHIVTSLHTEASRWRLDRLAAPHRTTLLATTPSTTPGHGIEPDETDLALMTALSTNPRQSAADLARDIQLSTNSVRRRLVRLDAAKFMACRCEVSRCASGWPIAVNSWGVMPPEHAARITTRVADLRQTRLCASVTGPNNLMFAAWLRAIDDLQPFETHLAKQVPELAITVRNLVLWHMKLGDRILDSEGRPIRDIPFSLWPQHDAIAAENTLLDRRRAGSA